MVSTKDQSHNCGSHYPPVGLLPVLTLPGDFSSSLLKWAAGFGDVVQQLVNMHAHIHTHTTALNWLLLTIVPALKVYTCESHGGETMLCEFIITERGEKSLHSGARVRKASFPFCLIVNDFRSNQLWPLGVSRNYWWNMESGLRNTAVRTYMYTPALHLHDILKFDSFFNICIQKCFLMTGFLFTFNFSEKRVLTPRNLFHFNPILTPALDKLAKYSEDASPHLTWKTFCFLPVEDGTKLCPWNTL